MNASYLRICLPLFIGLICGSWGCVVSQPPGRGKVFLRTEARTGAGYYLYLPADYIESEGLRPPYKKWPIVVSFHGMRPWDSAGAQIKEWQQEADRYGYVVIAPDTRVSDMLGELPIRRVSPSLKHDEEAIVAIMDEVYQTCDVNPNHALTTSWSMGGYLAHYMINRHPDRFSCLAVRQSNFSADILDPAKVPAYRDAKIAVFYTQNDFSICRQESRRAIDWYTRHGFDLTQGIVDKLGHERTPQTAAAFFASTCNAVAKTPPANLARITLTSTGASMSRAARDATQRRLARVNNPRRPATGVVTKKNRPSTKRPQQRPSNSPATSPKVRPPSKTDVTDPSGNLTRNKPLYTRPVAPPRSSQRSKTVDRRRARKKPEITVNPLEVRLSAYIGISPMLVSYTVQMPTELRKGADVLWMDNGQPISQGISGQKTLVKPGRHKIEVLVVSKDNRERRTSKMVTVLERLPLDEEDD